MISVFDDEKYCCGCTACKSICPIKAIEMKPDGEGFLYPVINQELCIECGSCRKVCPHQNKVVINDRFSEPLVYAIKYKDDEIRMKSTSGGIYTAISNYALELTNVIYGVKYDEKFNVHHAKATTTIERDKFRGSKYVQSDLKETFKQIQENLKNEQGVLFTGTGCQVAGLRKFLDDTKTNTDILITNDIICHGTPSPLLWGDYLKFVQKQSNLQFYTFRNKENGWHGYNVKAKFENGKTKINTSSIKVFSNLFSSNLVLRPSCYHCQYTNLHRLSDIMMGDFWGVEKTIPKIDDNKGISLVLVNTPKGKKILEEIKINLDVWESNTKDCLQPNLQYPTIRPERRDRFWQDYYKYGFKYIAKKYGGNNYRTRIKLIMEYINEKIGILDNVKEPLINSKT